MRTGTLEPFLGCKSLRQLPGLVGLWRDVFIFQKVSVRIQDSSHSFSKGHKIFLSNPERREMAALPLYTNGRNLFCSHPLCMEWSLPLIREFLPALLALPVGLGVRDWQCILLYGIGCINKELFSLTQGPILQQYPCIWNTKTRHVEKHSRLFTGFDRATCPHWEWSFFFIFASLMGENCLLTVFCFFFFFNLNAYI